MIRAECHSDDRRVEATFDATRWFELASNDEITALAECGWGGDYPADYIAHFMANRNKSVEKMFAYLEIMSDSKDAPGFECHVNSEDAMRWLRVHRPMLCSVLEKLGEVL